MTKTLKIMRKGYNNYISDPF